MGLFKVRAEQLSDVANQVMVYPVGELPAVVDELRQFRYQPASLAAFKVVDNSELILTRHAAFSTRHGLIGPVRRTRDALGQMALFEQSLPDNRPSVMTAAVIVPTRANHFMVGRAEDVVVHYDVTRQLDELSDNRQSLAEPLKYDEFYKQTISKAIFAVVHGSEQT